MNLRSTGDTTSFDGGAIRDSSKGKGRFDLIPALPLLRLARHYEFGGLKYGDSNWKLGQNSHACMSAAIRHCYMYLAGDREEDHLAAVAWNVFTVMWNEVFKKDYHDVDKNCEEYTEIIKLIYGE